MRDDQLYVMTPTGDDAAAKLTDATGGEEGEPAWAPDGRWIAYIRRLPGYTTREVWLVHADGKERQTADPSQRCELRAGVVARWTPNRLHEQRARRPVPALRDRRRRQGPAPVDLPARRVLRPLVVARRQDADRSSATASSTRSCSAARRTRSPTGRTTVAPPGGRSFPRRARAARRSRRAACGSPARSTPRPMRLSARGCRAG